MHIVLFEPQIPQNTGNIARTCVGTNSTLHLVGKLGFSLSDRYLRRAGLDYWKDLDLKVHKDWTAFLEAVFPSPLRGECPEKEGGTSHERPAESADERAGFEREGVGESFPFFFFEKDAKKNLWEAKFQPNSYLIFGSETTGFSPEILQTYQEHFYRIPMAGPIRSLNLSSAVAIALYESLRQTSFSFSLLVDR